MAYQVLGSGPFDLLCCYDLGSQIDLVWDIQPVLGELFASFARTIVFDRRGTGAVGTRCRAVALLHGRSGPTTLPRS